jgi:hypothetical protein
MASATTRKAHLENMNNKKELFPKYELHVVNTCVSVDEKRGKAVVWITAKVAGQPWEGMERESVSKVYWVRFRVSCLSNFLLVSFGLCLVWFRLVVL